MKNNTFFFFILAVSTILLTYDITKVLNTDTLIYQTLSEQFTIEQVNEAIEIKEKWEWLTYLAIPILLLLKIAVIAGILDFGLFFFESVKKIKYSKLFEIVTLAEFIFVFVIVFKLVWFYFFQTDYTLDDLQHFFPLSLLNIIGYENVAPWFVYPLQLINVFEMIYWVLLAFLLGKELNVNTDKGLSIVASSYGVGLLIWTVAMMFITLNMS